MGFTQFLAIVWARKWLGFAIFTLVVATAAVISMLLPKQYTSSASVVIDVRPDPVSSGVGSHLMASPAFLATQADVLSSDRVVLRVISDLQLHQNPSLVKSWQDEAQGKGTIEQWLAELLQRRLDVKPSRESNVITVSFTAPEPRFAATVANAFVKAYIAVSLEMRASPARGFKSLFDAQTQEARETLEQAQRRLSEYQQRKGIIATDERFDVENARLNELSSQLTQLQAIAADSASRQSQVQGGQGDRMQEVLTNPLIGSLKSDLSRMEVRLRELNARLGDNHPQVVEVRANVSEIQARIDAETRKVAGGVTVTNSINSGREQALQRELAAQRAKVLQMKAVRDEGVLLQRDVESAQRIYENLTLRKSQTELESQNSQSFAHQLGVAAPPTSHSTPRTGLNMVMAVLLGAVLAVAVTLVLELLDRRVRVMDDVVMSLGLPVLGSMPLPNARRYLAGNRRLPLALAPAHAHQLPAPASPPQMR